MNTQKKIFALVTVLVIIAIVSIFIFGRKSEDMSATTTPTVATSTLPTYTTQDVAAHATSTDCWSIVNGYVYDFTSFINQHPGGKKSVLQTCGVDSSAAYNSMHGGKKRPANELQKHLIGNLKI